MIKEARAWNNYKDYKPAVKFAKENKLSVIAANTPRRYVSMVSSIDVIESAYTVAELSNGNFITACFSNNLIDD